MKICLVSPYDFAREGGVNQHIMALAEEFRSLGHVVKIMAPSSADEEENPQTDPDIYRVGNVVPIKANGSVARITLALNLSGQIKTILREEQFDVVHLHEPLMPALPLTVLVYSKALNIGTFHAFSQSNIGYYYGRPILRYFVSKLDGRIAVSRPAHEFISQYFEGNYEIIPNPIDLARFHDNVEPLPRFADGKLNILFVGRFGERRKGLKYLMRAYNYVRQQIPNTRLIVVGKGDNKGYLRYLRHNNITDVIFTGYVPDDELVRYYKSAHVFCAPSTGGESFGIVLVEAMASGLPVVASDIPGYASVIEHGKQGLLVEPRNEETLAMALIRVLADADLRQKMAAEGQEKAALYSWRKVSQRVLDYYARSENRRRARLRLKQMRRNRRSARTYGLGWLLGRRYAGRTRVGSQLESKAPPGTRFSIKRFRK